MRRDRGESGTGKSVSARALLGLLPAGLTARTDELEVDGVDARSFGERQWRGLRGDRIALVSQDALVSLDPLRRIGAEVAEPVRIHEPDVRGTALAARVRESLERCRCPSPRRGHVIPPRAVGRSAAARADRLRSRRESRRTGRRRADDGVGCHRAGARARPVAPHRRRRRGRGLHQSRPRGGRPRGGPRRRDARGAHRRDRTDRRVARLSRDPHTRALVEAVSHEPLRRHRAPTPPSSPPTP